MSWMERKISHTEGCLENKQRIEQLEARIKVLEEAFLVLQQRVKDYESQ